MCMECGVSTHISEEYIVKSDPFSSESKILDSLLVCEICGGQLMLVGKAGDEPFYRLECLKDIQIRKNRSDINGKYPLLRLRVKA